MDRRNFLKTGAAGAAATPLLTSSLFAQSASGQPKTFSAEKIKQLRDRIKPITADERLKRIERAKELMNQNKVDALIFEGGTTLGYYTNVNWWRSERLFAMVLPRNGEPQYVTPKF